MRVTGAVDQLAELRGALEALLDRQAIAEVLVRYCRGVDRCDAALLKSVYWPDATDDHGTFSGNAHAFVEQLIPALLAMDRTMHAISNVSIRLLGEQATAETYCRAYHEFDGPSGKVEMEVGGRYLDRFEKRGGEWRIAHRLYVMDWNRNGPSTASWTEGIYARLQVRGGRGAADPACGFGF
ncbi:nuclear transport factor 2 family protein [Thermaurantiacus sp.]